MSDFETAHQLEKAKASKGKIPAGISFEKVIKNRTLPPCSLNHFMDYLYYVEHSAQSLQFFLWYYEYIQRWSQLPPEEKALAAVWDPEKVEEPRPRYITYSHKRAVSEKMNKILSIMDMEPKASKDGSGDRQSTQSATPALSHNFSKPRNASVSSTNSSTSSNSADWQPATSQPFRDEVSRIVQQYITEGSPRQLHLAPKDRDYCLQASQHTTHPSALLPAFIFAEANLRGHSHPKFVRWSMTNVNRPRMIFLRLVGFLLLFLGTVVDILFMLSGLSRFLRILCLLLWWPGITVSIAAVRGLCIMLHFRNLRHVRPWEQFGDAEPYAAKEGPKAKTLDGDSDDEDFSRDPEKGAAGGRDHRKHARTNTKSSQTSAVDPLRKASLQTFGPENDYAREPWVRLYATKSLWSRVFEATVPAQNRSLVLLQDRTIFFAVLWGGVLASTLTVVSLFVPVVGIYLRGRPA